LEKIGNSVNNHDVYNFLYGRELQYPVTTKRAIYNYLQEKEDKNFPLENNMFCETSIVLKMAGVCTCCKQDADMGIIIGPSGLGKTEFLRELKRTDRSVLLATGDPTVRSLGSILLVLSRLLPGVSKTSCSNAVFMDRIIDHLRGGNRLLVIDEAHFLSWESIEALRRIYDACGVGLVFVGQQKMYDEMRGGNRKSLLWDQIFSRIGIRAHFKGDVPIEDVTLICNKVYPAGLDNKCLGYLHDKANGPGKFRSMVKLLQRAQRLAELDNKKVTLTLLQQVSKFLMV
jgi:DNA transposition AAA+ family ATPase